MSGERVAPLAGDSGPRGRMATEACELAEPTCNSPAAAPVGSGAPRRISHLLTGTYVGLLGEVRSRRGDGEAAPRLHESSACTRRSSIRVCSMLAVC